MACLAVEHQSTQRKKQILLFVTRGRTLCALCYVKWADRGRHDGFQVRILKHLITEAGEARERAVGKCGSKGTNFVIRQISSEDKRQRMRTIVQIRSVARSCPTLCDPMNHSMPGLPVHHQLPEFTETHVHRVSDAIQPSHSLSSPSPPEPNPSQHQSLFQ